MDFFNKIVTGNNLMSFALKIKDYIYYELLGGKRIRYATQAEYDALSDSEKNNEEIIWNITDLDVIDYVTEDELNAKADKTELHSHSNKTVLDEITSAKITEWNNKSTFSGSYNDLIDKPSIPSVTNDLTNTLKANYDAAYTHSISTHAPVNAQKNSDITKAEIEAKLVGTIESHTHNTINGYTIWTGTQLEYDLISDKDSSTLYFIIKED